jgi:hypothetical protein
MALDPPENNPMYWAARLAQAVRDGDRGSLREAQRQLRRLGIPLTVGTQRKGVARVSQ